MRILYLSSNPNYLGGAALTDQALVARLRTLGHACQLTDYRDFDDLRRRSLDFEPDRIVCSGDTVFDAVRLSKRYGIPCLAYLHSYEYCPPPRWKARLWCMGKPPRPIEQTRWALEQADVLVANSNYFRDYLLRVHGLNSRVIEPAFEPERFMLDRPRRGRYVSGVCGLPHKGVRIFLELARAFPNLPFLMVGPVLPKFRRLLECLPNVKFRRLGDPRRWLAQTRLLLAPAQWAEPFGRMAVEAMANDIPVLASGCGGLVEILNGDCVRSFRSSIAWRRELEAALSRKFSEHLAGRVRHLIYRDSGGAMADLLAELSPTSPRRVVHWQGEASTRTAHMAINSHWGARPAPPWLARDLTIHHDYREDFVGLQPPSEGRWVAVRTWDFGRYPRSWVEKIERQFDELWVYSRWTKRQAVASGISAARVRVLPPGVDLQLFNPAGPVYPLATEKTHRLLFLGASIYRKGIDILLKAYALAFSRSDDVCLVIKDREADVFYSGQTYSREIAEFQSDPSLPEVVYLPTFLSDLELASLYRSCNAAVFPYRAEGFALPILEAMAVGLPVVVPDRGPCWDYVHRDCSYPVACRHLRIPVTGRWVFNSLGMAESLEQVEFLETDPEALAQTLRRLVANPADLLGKGMKAHIRAQNWSWEASRRRLEDAIANLELRTLPRRNRLAREEAQRRLRLLRAARVWLTDAK
ncbi:glycosyltransferase [bacterium]|nr:glycosyltransferase [bacterium]